MSLAIKLDVPLKFQEDDYSCTPTCMKMVLEYIRNKFSEGFPDLGISLIAKTVKASADEGGTTFENVELINEKLKKVRPSLRFVAGSGHRFAEIKEELTNDHPVITWVMMPSSQGDFPHSLVIRGIKEQELLIYCNDPVYGREEIPIRKFIDMWEKSFRILIKVEIGEEQQRSIDEWVENQENLGGSEL